jgi:hypothetical protein
MEIVIDGWGAEAIHKAMRAASTPSSMRARARA